MGKSQDLYCRAKKIIPGGTQLLSKRPEMFLPDHWPAYYKKSKGCEVWDLDGNRFIDMSYMGIGTCVLGYADPDVGEAVKKAIDNGSMSTLNCPEEVELAELLCHMHPWADMVRFARTGGEAMTVASRIARAATQKDIVLFCGYHGWHDWYLAANLSNDGALKSHLLPGLEPAGVPKGITGTAVPFYYNDLDSFQRLVKKYSGRIAAVVMEPVRNHQPDPGFLETIREQTTSEGIVLVYDEITSGWRLTSGGSHLTFSVSPDITVFAKGMSNGYPMAAIIGKAYVMSHAQDTFISSTYWTERIGPTAALATIRKFQENAVHEHLQQIGARVQNGWLEAARTAGLPITVSGMNPLGHFSFDSENNLILKTLFTQLMLEKGFLATTAFYASYAHNEKYVTSYLHSVRETFNDLAQMIEQGNVEQNLKGPVCHTGFSRLT